MEQQVKASIYSGEEEAKEGAGPHFTDAQTKAINLFKVKH